MSDSKSKCVLHGFSASTVSRAVQHLIAEQKLDVEILQIDMFKGAHKAPEYLKINPQGLIPTLVEGDFILTESSAILKYLAEKFSATSVYPTDLKKKAKVNEAMDWCNTELYKAFGYDFIYPQAFSTGKDLTEGKKNSRKKLWYLNDTILANGKKFMTGDDLTIADYLGYAFVTLGNIVRQDFSPLKNVTAWLARIAALSTTSSVYGMFNGWCASKASTPFHQLSLSNLKLYYFAGRGRGELTRILFAEGRVEYEDVRIESKDWANHKASMPFGQMPVLEIDGLKVPESLAIERYAATVAGLYGASLLEAARVDMMVGACGDLYEPFGQANYTKDEKVKEEKFKKFWAEDFPKWNAILEKNLGDNNYFVGSDVTLADIMVYHVYTNVLAKNKDALKGDSKISALLERVAKRHRIASWIEKRPKSEW